MMIQSNNLAASPSSLSSDALAPEQESQNAQDFMAALLMSQGMMMPIQQVQAPTEGASQAEKELGIQNVDTLLQSKAQASASGLITGMMTAGPQNPWNSGWVLPKSELKGSLEELNLSAEELKKLHEFVKNQGGSSSITDGMSLDEILKLAQATKLKDEGQVSGMKMGGSDFLNLLNQVQPQKKSASHQPGSEEGPLKDLKMNSLEVNTSKDSKKEKDFDVNLLEANLAGVKNTIALLKPVVAKVEGQVMQSDSLHEVSNSMVSLAHKGGGEMKIRLAPDHLGELSIRVNSKGQNVGLEIQASSQEAKNILQGNLDSLRESLAGQNLSLAKVDIQVHQPHSSAQDSTLAQQGSREQSSSQSYAQEQRENNRDRASERKILEPKVTPQRVTSSSKLDNRLDIVA